MPSGLQFLSGATPDGLPNIPISLASLPIGALLANQTQGLRTNSLDPRSLQQSVATVNHIPESSSSSQRVSASASTSASTSASVCDADGVTDTAVLGATNSGIIPNRPPISLAMSYDEANLPPLQCFVRNQIEVFQATREDVTANAQGRNRPVVLGQVGVRCRHCAVVPHKLRQPGSAYFPRTVRLSCLDVY